MLLRERDRAPRGDKDRRDHGRSDRDYRREAPKDRDRWACIQALWLWHWGMHRLFGPGLEHDAAACNHKSI